VRRGRRWRKERGSSAVAPGSFTWLLSNPPLPDRAFQRVFSEFLDWDEPSLFKSFLRVDASSEEIRIRCFATTGWRADELDPPVEDEVRISLAGRVSLPRSAVRER
jgi:hypothetical protein